MSKFCKYCGKELEDGMVCNCTESTQEEEVNSAENYDIKYRIKGFWNFFKDFVKNPVSVGSRFVNTCDFKFALCLIGLQSVLLGFLVASLVGKYNSAIKSAVAMAGSYADGVQSTVAGVMFSIPTIFVVTAVATFAMACILALVLMLFIKLFKGYTTYQYMLCVSAMNSLTLSPFILLGLIVSFITPLSIDLNNLSSFGGVLLSAFIVPIVIATLGMALGNYIMLSVMPAGCDVNNEFCPYIMFLNGLVVSIVFIFVYKTAVSMCLPSAIKSGFDAMGSAENLLESLF